MLVMTYKDLWYYRCIILMDELVIVGITVKRSQTYILGLELQSLVGL